MLVFTFHFCSSHGSAWEWPGLQGPKNGSGNDFSFSGLHLRGGTLNPVGSKVTPVTVAQLPGLNTLDISLAHIDYAPWGINPPHTHPRATEILVVQEGTLEVGFIASNPDNHFISKVLQMRDVFEFPQGLLHFERKISIGMPSLFQLLEAKTLGSLPSLLPCLGLSPDVPIDILAKAFQVDKSVVNQIQSKF